MCSTFPGKQLSHTRSSHILSVPASPSFSCKPQQRSWMPALSPLGSWLALACLNIANDWPVLAAAFRLGSLVVLQTQAWWLRVICPSHQSETSTLLHFIQAAASCWSIHSPTFWPLSCYIYPWICFLDPWTCFFNPCTQGSKKNRREGVEKTGGPVRQEPVECKAFCLDLEHYPILLSQLLETQQDPLQLQGIASAFQFSHHSDHPFPSSISWKKNCFFCHWQLNHGKSHKKFWKHATNDKTTYILTISPSHRHGWCNMSNASL